MTGIAFGGLAQHVVAPHAPAACMCSSASASRIKLLGHCCTAACEGQQWPQQQHVAAQKFPSDPCMHAHMLTCLHARTHGVSLTGTVHTPVLTPVGVAAAPLQLCFLSQSRALQRSCFSTLFSLFRLALSHVWAACVACLLSLPHRCCRSCSSCMLSRLAQACHTAAARCRQQANS